MDEVKVVEEPLPVIQVRVAGVEFPRSRPTQQDVDDMPGAKHGARQARMPLIGIPIDDETPTQHQLARRRRVVLLGIAPQCGGARICLDVLGAGEMKGQPGSVTADLAVWALKHPEGLWLAPQPMCSHLRLLLTLGLTGHGDYHLELRRLGGLSRASCQRIPVPIRACDRVVTN